MTQSSLHLVARGAGTLRGWLRKICIVNLFTSKVTQTVDVEFIRIKLLYYLGLSSLSPGCSLEYSSIGSRFLRPV